MVERFSQSRIRVRSGEISSINQDAISNMGDQRVGQMEFVPLLITRNKEASIDTKASISLFLLPTKVGNDGGALESKNKEIQRHQRSD